ncbi:MAG TPA: HDOD domain-containing protein [Desulfobacteria bacterium]|nr:HDOD domain-containing protein [Desulfobacteria bacterium]
MEVFVARQPIFDKNQNVFAYELLYRTGDNNQAQFSDEDMATSHVVANSFLVIGIESITGGKRAFINFTGNLLDSEFVSLLPRELVSIEILENVTPDEATVSACRRLKEMGYTLVLDDFVYALEYEPLIKLADIIKVDFLNTPEVERKEIVKRLKGYGIKFLAEKVETPDDFKMAVEAGYEYFQGYFFSKPVVVSGRDMPIYNVNYFRILQEVNQPEPDFDRLEAIIMRDVSLTYKLLQYINSATHGLKSKIKSIKHALVLLGTTEIRKWISLVALKGVSEDKPDELMRSSVVRARFGEFLAPKVGFGDSKSEIFLMGLFSMIDALTDTSLVKVMQNLPLPEEVKTALLGQPGKYSDVFGLIKSYEKGEWDTFYGLAFKVKLEIGDIPDMFIKSLEWTDRLLA